MAIKVPEKLTTERLALRRHRMTDLEAFASFLADPAATRHMAFTPEQKTRAAAQQMLEYVISSYDSDVPILSLTIADPFTDDYLGSCGLNPLATGDGVEIYFTILAEHQNRGLATEAGKALIAFALESSDTERISAFVVPENGASVRVLEKLGFVDQGAVERQATTGEVSHASLAGRHYLLTRPSPSVR